MSGEHRVLRKRERVTISGSCYEKKIADAVTFCTCSSKAAAVRMAEAEKDICQLQQLSVASTEGKNDISTVVQCFTVML